MRLLKIGKLRLEWGGVSKKYMTKMIVTNTVSFDNDPTRINYIHAIKWHRQYVLDHTGKTPSLKESKEYVEKVLTKKGIPWQNKPRS